MKFNYFILCFFSFSIMAMVTEEKRPALHFLDCVNSDDAQGALKLIKSGIVPNNEVVCDALAKQKNQILKVLLERYIHLEDSQNPINHQALFIALLNGNENAARLLISSGASLEKRYVSFIFGAFGQEESIEQAFQRGKLNNYKHPGISRGFAILEKLKTESK
jgi:ankyrin repeat protein